MNNETEIKKAIAKCKKIVITGGEEGDGLVYNASIDKYVPSPVAASSSTASNVGSAGTGVYKQQVGIDLEFKKLNSVNSILTIADDLPNSKIDFTINESVIDHNQLDNTHNLTTDIDHDTITNTHNLTTDIDHDTITNTHNLTTDIVHQNINGAGSKTHAEIDTHLNDTTGNPHEVTLQQGYDAGKDVNGDDVIIIDNEGSIEISPNIKFNNFGETSIHDHSIYGNGGLGHTITAHGSAGVSQLEIAYNGGSCNVPTGQSNYLSVPNSPDFVNRNKLTVAGWYYQSSFPLTNHPLIGVWTSPGQLSWLLQVGDDGTLYIIFPTSVSVGGSHGAWTASGTISTGQLYYIEMVYDGTGATDADKIKLYVSSDLPGGTATNRFLSSIGTIPTTLTNANELLTIGRTGVANGDFDGYMDDIYISTDVLHTGAPFTTRTKPRSDGDGINSNAVLYLPFDQNYIDCKYSFLNNVHEPTDYDHAATKNYVDDNITPKGSVTVDATATGQTSIYVPVNCEINRVLARVVSQDGTLTSTASFSIGSDSGGSWSNIVSNADQQLDNTVANRDARRFQIASGLFDLHTNDIKINVQTAVVLNTATAQTIEIVVFGYEV